MTILPVIARELRAQARQRFTFTLRELGVLGLLVCGFFFSVDADLPQNIVGPRLFRFMHLTLFFTVWVLVPLSASDCISRERREGTLGLLFLTPLKPHDIVIAKSVAHGLRAVTLLIAVLPVLMIPVLLGGVSWQHATMAALTDVSALCFALGAALVASAATRNALRAMAGSVGLAIAGLLIYFTVVGVIGHWILGRWRMRNLRWEDAIEGGVVLSGIGREFPTDPRTISSGVWGAILQALSSSALVAAVGLLVAIGFAAWRIRRNWREEPAPQWMQDVQKKFCTPVVWKNLFRRWMRWLLERNPIGWLERRTWTGRLVTWGWFAIIISIYSAVFTDNNFFRNQSGIHATLAWLLMGSIAASVAGSFRRERESGVLELLLVAPMTSRQIIGGRLRGLWGQFLPAIAMLLFVWGYFAQLFQNWDEFPKMLFFAGTFLTLPVIGLYFSVRSRSFIAAFLLTLIFGLFLPVMMVIATALFLRFADFGMQPFVPLAGFWSVSVCFQFLMAGLFGVLLHRRLQRRNFPVERALA